VTSVPAPRAAKTAGPRLLSVEVTPPRIVLETAEGRQQIAVTGRYSDGLRRDLTEVVRLSLSGPPVARIEGTAVSAARSGFAQLVVRVPGSGVIVRTPVAVSRAEAPIEAGFGRHVVPVMNKFGCASGSCHGSFSGRGGFRLSLFGFDAGMDFHAVAGAGEGRRINRSDPGNSLLLLKPTLAVPHVGGRRFEVGSRPFRLLSEWIAQGARRSDEPKVTALEVFPDERMLPAGTRQQLVVTARYDDGTTVDVTDLAKYVTVNEDVATVQPDGKVSAQRTGDAAITAEFGGKMVHTRILVPGSLELVRAYPTLPRANYVDEHVQTKLRKLGIVPSDLCTDAEFLRRASLDLCGTTPTVDEIRRFEADSGGDKRARKVDELLQRDEYAHYWATFLCDLTGNDNRFLPTPRETAAQRWQSWFFARLKENTPWDQIARGVVAAESREGKTTTDWFTSARRDMDLRLAKGNEKWDASDYTSRRSLDLYWLKSGNDAATVGRQISYVFLGVKIECAECHKHPYDRWTQDDFKGFTAFFQRVNRGLSAETKRMVTEQGLNAANLNEVHFDPKLRGAAPHFFDGETLDPAAPTDPRVALADWMAKPENPFFGRAIVNRIWARHLGRGIVDPPDAFSAANPPTNPALLDALAQDFISHRFDLRHLHRTILTSRTYQSSWRTNPSNEKDEQNFSHYPIKQLPAEVMLDAINQATGAVEDWGIYGPPGARAISIGSSRVGGMAGYVLKTFGRPTRSQSCDCERANVPGLPQALYLINDQHVQGKIADRGGYLRTALDAGRSDGELVDELYLSVLGRGPTSSERQKAFAHLSATSAKQEAFEDVMWALFNTREFFTNH
jgi:hypothetical protein